MHFISLLVRYLNEPYIQEFVDYYFSEGIDHIYLLYDEKSTLPLPNSILENKNISIKNANISSQPRENLWKASNEWFQEFKQQTTWVIYVDCDEFISIYKRNPSIRIRKFLMNLQPKVDCVKIPWVMMSCNGRKKDPPSILQHITHRWNYNIPHPSNHSKSQCMFKEVKVKCIFKAASYKHFNDHFPDKSSKPNPLCINGVTLQKDYHNSAMYNLREHQLAQAYIVCFHYRLISQESCIRKTTNNGFEAYRIPWRTLMEGDHPDIAENFLRKKSLKRFGEIDYRCPSA